MEDELIEKTYALKESLDHDERLLLLKEKEREMEENEEVMLLSYYFQRAQDEYNDALRHFKEESEEVKKAQKILFEKKKALDEHPLVQAYLKAYKDVREVYEEIQQTLFEPFHTAYQCKEKK